MTGRPFAEVASVGSAVPERVLTNHELSQVLDTSDQWIVERTGIRERRIAAPDQTVAMLSRDASLLALDRAGVGVEELDTIVLATAWSAGSMSRSAICTKLSSVAAKLTS